MIRFSLVWKRQSISRYFLTGQPKITPFCLFILVLPSWSYLQHAVMASMVADVGIGSSSLVSLGGRPAEAKTDIAQVALKCSTLTP
jgi:hypothetical protein